MTAVAGRLVVVGPGRVGISLALAAADAGSPERVVIVGRGPDRPPGLGSRPDVRYVSGGEATALLSRRPLPHVAFCVPDDRLHDVVHEWAARAGEAAPADPSAAAAAEGGSAPVALHTSGVHPADLLAPLRAAGWAVAGWHPLVAIARPRADAFSGVSVGVEGDPRGRELAAGLAAALGARPLRIATCEKARYHAAAVFASNHVAACLGVALRELRGSGADGAVLEDLLPLARSALHALESAGIPGGLTGPAVRGDAGTVRRHLDALDPRTGGLYRALNEELARLLAGDGR